MTLRTFSLRAAAGAADLLVAPAFGSPGFALRARTWNPAAIPSDLSGRSFAVTGASSGIGRAAAEALLARGARVELLCRDRQKGDEVARVARAAGWAGTAVVRLVDMESLASVRALADAWEHDGVTLDGLVHNAGALFHERATTEDGLERTFALHVAGPFTLTLLARKRLARGARVVFVASGGMYGQPLVAGDLQWERGAFDGVKAYARAKRAQVLLARRFARDWTPIDGIEFAAMHPGWVDTDALRTALPGFRRMTKSFLRTPAQGADTIVWLLASPEASPLGGRFFFDRLPRRIDAPLARTRASEADVDRLWEACAALAVPPRRSAARAAR